MPHPIIEKLKGQLDVLLKRHVIGLDIGASGIKAVELQGKRHPRLLAYNRVPLPWGTISADGVIQDTESVVEALKSLFETTQFSTKKVAIGAAGNAVITKKIKMPKMSISELNHQLYWEAEQYIPFDVSEVNLDYAIIGNSINPEDGSPMLDILLVAAKKDYIEGLTGVIDEAGLSPEVVDIQAFALGNAYEFNYGHLAHENATEANLVVDFGAGSTKVSVIEGDKTTFARDIRRSGAGCTQAISDRLQVSVSQAERVKLAGKYDTAVSEIVGEYVKGMVDEVSHTLDFFVGQAPDRTVQGVYICGGGSKLPGLLPALKKKMPAPVEELNPIQGVTGSGKKMNPRAIEELSYLGAVAIGLSLRTIGDAA